MPKQGKKNWKDQERERQIKQQRNQQTYQRQSKPNRTNKRSKLRSVKIILSAICLITLLLTAYGIWQYYEGQKPPTIGSGSIASGSSSTTSAPSFSLKDINGTQVSLSDFSGKVIGIHFMAVGCHGQINPINEYQLAQLNSACNSLCGEESTAFLTVAVATCESSDLNVLRSNYGITWTLGNDYSDGTLEIVNSYVPFEIGDGAVVLVDKTSNIAQIYNGGVSANTLVAKINQLVGA
jgi:hypothetical protein